jgi:hypothetical protein
MNGGERKANQSQPVSVLPLAAWVAGRSVASAESAEKSVVRIFEAVCAETLPSETRFCKRMPMLLYKDKQDRTMARRRRVSGPGSFGSPTALPSRGGRSPGQFCLHRESLEARAGPTTMPTVMTPEIAPSVVAARTPGGSDVRVGTIRRIRVRIVNTAPLSVEGAVSWLRNSPDRDAYVRRCMVGDPSVIAHHARPGTRIPCCI